jgi:hypothetical protein
MAIFDYRSQAELSPTATEVEIAPIRHRKTRQPIGYGRFARAADLAIEELPHELLMAAQLKVADEQFNSDGIRRLYESVEYPLARRGGKASSVSRGIEIGSHDQGKRRFQATCLRAGATDRAYSG